MGTQIQETTRSERAELSATPRTVSAAESTAPSSSEGVDVQDWDQVVAVFSGDVNGFCDVQPWLRYAKYDQGSGRANIWVPQAIRDEVPVVGYSATTGASGAIVLNTLGADRLHCLVTGFTTITKAYVKYYGLTPKGGVPIDIPDVPVSVTIAAGTKVQGMAAEDDAAVGNPLLGGGRYDSSPRTLETGDVGAIALDAGARQQVVGAAAADAAVVGAPVQVGGVYRAAGQTLDDGDVGELTLDAAGRPNVVGAAAEDDAAAGNPLLAGGRYDASPRSLDDGDVGALALDPASRQMVVGPVGENAVAVGNPLLSGGRYDSSARTLGNGDVGAIALDVAGQVIVVGSVAHDGADAGAPVLMGAHATAADEGDVDEDDRARLSCDLQSYLRVRDKSYDAAADANKVAPTYTAADLYTDPEELIDSTNVAAATNYYPSSSGLEMGEYNHLCIQGSVAGGVTVTIEAIIEDSGTDWVDITPAGYDLLTDATGAASFVDSDFLVDFEGLNVWKVRIKSVTADATNSVQYHIRRRFS